MPTLTVAINEIYKFLDQLDIETKIEIFERLKPQVLSKRWDALLARVDERLTKYPISENEINEEIGLAREEIASYRRRCS